MLDKTTPTVKADSLGNAGIETLQVIAAAVINPIPTAF